MRQEAATDAAPAPLAALGSTVIFRTALTLLALAAPAASPMPASAHARVDSTVPTDGAVVARQPASVSFTFDEPVEGSFGAVRVFDAASARVDRGATFHPGGSGQAIAVRLRPGLPKGTYTATYRVVSADGHPVAGGFVFSIGQASATNGASVADLAGPAGAGPVTSTAFAAARAVQYSAIAVAAGLLIFLLAVFAPALRVVPAREAVAARAAFAARLRSVLGWVAVAGAASGALAVALEGAVGSGTSLWTALRLSVIGETLGTRFGLVWTTGVGLWTIAGLSLARWRRVPAAAGAAPLAALVLLPALGGHAATLQPIAVFLLANVLHVASIAAWFGGLVALLAVLPVVTRALGEPHRVAFEADALQRFSRIALLAVALLVWSGTLQAVLELSAIRDLVDSAFGRAIVVKVVVLAAAGVFAWRNHARHVPTIVGSDTTGTPAEAALAHLRSGVRREVALVAVIFGASGALAGYPPPSQLGPAAASSSGPVTVDRAVGPGRVRATINPARVGPNRLDLVLTAADGSPLTVAKEVTVSAVETTRGIGPLALPVSSGPVGTFSGSAVLPAQGTWRLTIVVRVSDFDEYQTAITVPVR